MIDKKLSDELLKRARAGDRTVLRSVELRSLYDELKVRPAAERASFGKAINDLKNGLLEQLDSSQGKQSIKSPIDVTAPWDANSKKPQLLPAMEGTVHPLMSELNHVLDIYARMGFASVESRQIDDD